VREPLKMWRHPLVHAVACVGLVVATVLANVFLF
jgi:hypothetical protein